MIKKVIFWVVVVGVALFGLYVMGSGFVCRGVDSTASELMKYENDSLGIFGSDSLDTLGHEIDTLK